MIYLRSSNLRSVSYEEFSERLDVYFHSGRHYAYFDVPHAVYELLLSAQSHGRWFHEHIRDEYPCRRIR